MVDKSVGNELPYNPITDLDKLNRQDNSKQIDEMLEQESGV